MADPDPELQKILNQKVKVLQARAKFFEDVNQNGVNNVEDHNINELISKSPIPVIVDFSADSWCKPCMVMAPIYEELSHEYAERVLFLKINTDHNRRASEQYRIMSVPTFMMFKEGKKFAQKLGAAPKPKFKAWIDEVLHRMQ